MDRVSKIVESSYAYKQGIYGKNIGIAILDTGIGKHIDLKGRVLAYIDFCYGVKRVYDDNGHGTHIAGIIGGTGAASEGRYRGIAPQCNYIVLKVLDRMGNGNTADVIRACDWVMLNREKYNIRIINISVGMKNIRSKTENRRLIKKLEEVWDQGIIVVAAAGNQGPYENSVTIPGICETIITVGSSDDEILANNKNGLWSGYSGRGPTSLCVVKPEILAPGTNVISCGLKNDLYERKSGTSMATPVVTGAIALLLEKYPEMTPAEVKLRIHDRAVDLGKSMNEQGWGRINVRKLLS